MVATMSRMPAQRPATSEQTVCTPRQFLDAITKRFGPIDFDLACTKENCVTITGFFFDRGDDALVRDWPAGPLNFLNPEFGQCAVFAERAANQMFHRNVRTLMLVPLGTTRWFQRWVKPYAYEMRLATRLKFVGHTSPYPKDLALYAYMHGMTGSEVWDWKAQP
jgi:phage N-6-adenine-methyltransferase